MKKQITFISITELKDSTIIQANVDEKILNRAILEFQELELEPLLGEALYKRLSNVIVSGATTPGYVLSDADTLLMAKIKPYLSYGTLVYSFNELHYKVTNAGIQILTDSNSKSSSGTDISVLKSSYTTKLDAYKKRLIDYIRVEDVEDEPELSCDSNQDTTFNFTGISMGDNSYDWETEYRNSVYKTGYYRRRIY